MVISIYLEDVLYAKFSGDAIEACVWLVDLMNGPIENLRAVIEVID